MKVATHLSTITPKLCQLGPNNTGTWGVNTTIVQCAKGDSVHLFHFLFIFCFLLKKEENHWKINFNISFLLANCEEKINHIFFTGLFYSFNLSLLKL